MGSQPPDYATISLRLVSLGCRLTVELPDQFYDHDWSGCDDGVDCYGLLLESALDSKVVVEYWSICTNPAVHQGGFGH